MEVVTVTVWQMALIIKGLRNVHPTTHKYNERKGQGGMEVKFIDTSIALFKRIFPLCNSEQEEATESDASWQKKIT